MIPSNYREECLAKKAYKYNCTLKIIEYPNHDSTSILLEKDGKELGCDFPNSHWMLETLDFYFEGLVEKLCQKLCNYLNLQSNSEG